MLTFAVPNCVATYGAVSYRWRQEHDHSEPPGRLQ